MSCHVTAPDLCLAACRQLYHTASCLLPGLLGGVLRRTGVRKNAGAEIPNHVSYRPTLRTVAAISAVLHAPVSRLFRQYSAGGPVGSGLDLIGYVFTVPNFWR